MNQPQRLPELSATVCAACGNRVYFHARSSTADRADPHFRLVYLRCPACGASAVQRQEVVANFRELTRTRVKFVYRRG